jgi:hypothetical protein
MNIEEKPEKNLSRFAAAKYFLDLLKWVTEPNIENALRDTGLNTKDRADDFRRWIEGNYNSNKKRMELFEQGIGNNDLLRKLYKEWIAFLKDQAAPPSTKNNPELTQRQRAIVLFFKAKANDITHPTRQDLIKEDNGSLALYNLFCDVQKGKYKIDDLETAIEFLTEFPAAHAMAKKEIEKS